MFLVVVCEIAGRDGAFVEYRSPFVDTYSDKKNQSYFFSKIEQSYQRQSLATQTKFVFFNKNIFDHLLFVDE